MKKKILSLLFIVMLLPCMFLFTACGEPKSVANTTYVYAKCEVTGDVSKSDTESAWQNYSFRFKDTTVEAYNGTELDEIYNYSYKNNVATLEPQDELYTTIKLKANGEYLVYEKTVPKGTIKVYFKVSV